MNENQAKVRAAVCESIIGSKTETLLLSGGVDSSILAAINPELKTYTVGVENCGDDRRYAQILSKHINCNHTQIDVTAYDAINRGLPTLVGILRSFDLGILNDLPLFYGMEAIKADGFNSVMTGECPDWLFAGYSFLWDKGESANEYIRDALPHIPFSSKAIAKHFELELDQPYLFNKLIEIALDIPFGEKVSDLGLGVYGDTAMERYDKQQDSISSNAYTWSKIVLREAFADRLPTEIAWRPRCDLEFGSGCDSLVLQMSSKENVLDHLENEFGPFPYFWGGEAQKYLFKTYKSLFGSVPHPGSGEGACPGCGAGISPRRSHCSICGFYDQFKHSVAH